MQTTRVLIAGAGIAGLAAANALAGREGWEIELVDPDPRPVGVAVGLSSCALRALQGVGALAAVLEASAPSMTLHMCLADGTTLVHTERESPEGQPYPDNVLVDRWSLAQALRAPLDEADVHITSGVGVTGIDIDDDGALVSFDNREPRRYDLVVGADGIASRLRGAVMDETPRGLEQLGLRWVTSALDGIDHGIMYLGSGAVKLGLWPLRDGRMYAFVTLPRPGRPREARETILAELQRALEQFTFPGADRLREEVPWQEVHIAPFQTFLPESPWHRGRLVLVGDAAHVMPPHGSSGAAMAIEDAFVLAEELDDATIDTALAGYSQRRIERVRRVVDYSTKNCIAENDAAAAGRPAPPLDPVEAQEFWAFLRTDP